MKVYCAHTGTVRVTEPSAYECVQCVAAGRGDWLHLRLCTACGHVGCCDKSPGRHATKHFVAQAHPIIRSIERDEGWYWCYEDEVFLDVDLPSPAGSWR